LNSYALYTGHIKPETTANVNSKLPANSLWGNTAQKFFNFAPQGKNDSISEKIDKEYPDVTCKNDQHLFSHVPLCAGPDDLPSFC
jgi:hypothetical protein